MINKRINHVKYDEGFEDRFDIMINNTVDSSFEGKLIKKNFFLQCKTGVLFRNTAKTVLFGTIADGKVLYWYGKNRLFVVSMILYYVFVFLFLLFIFLISITNGVLISKNFIMVCIVYLFLNIILIVLTVINSRKEKRILYNKLMEICGGCR